MSAGGYAAGRRSAVGSLALRARSRRRALAGFTALLLLAGACSRSDDESETNAGSDTTAAGGSDTTAAAGGEDRLDAGGFGTLTDVCQDGDATGAADVGVTDDSIQIGTLTDKGFTARPGLTQEMYDAAVAFAAWCNEHGGINGRELVVADRDAALANYNDQVVRACEEDLAFVGGGAVLDDSDNGGRVACGLPNIPGYVVSAIARGADLQVQPVPNPLTPLALGQYRQLALQHPDLINRYGVLTTTFGPTLLVRDGLAEAATAAGFTTVYSREYNATGESNWRPFVEELQQNDVQILEYVGEPENLVQLQEAMDLVGYHPQITTLSGNFYDRNYADLAADLAVGVEIRAQFTPFELADANVATADYLELMDRYNPGGKVALLGAQATSALLLFAQSAAACGSDLTRACLLEQARSVTDWTGGGLHAPQNPSAHTPSSCFASLTLTPAGFAIDEELTAATDGIFNCDPDNLIPVTAGS